MTTPSHRRPPRRYSVPVVEQPAITPENKVGITIKQLVVGALILIGAGGSLGSVLWIQSQQGSSISKIETAMTAVTAATPNAIKDQDEKRTAALKDQEDKRAAMAREFLASNREIAAKVGDLATAIAVQQANANATKDALVKIGDQLNTLVHQMPEKRR